MIRLALIVGHTKADKGAEGTSPLNMQEYDYNAGLAQTMKDFTVGEKFEIGIFFRDAHGVEGAYRDAVKFLTGNTGAIIELHFNAANRKATGTEVLYADAHDAKGVNEKYFAQCVQDAVCKVFERELHGNRGIKVETSGRGYSNLSQTTKFPAVIVEPFFGDVRSEAEMAVAKKNMYAMGLINAFKKFMGV